MGSPDNAGIIDYSSPSGSERENLLEAYPSQSYNEFLITIVRMAQGDFNKKIMINDVWNSIGLKALEGDYKFEVIREIVYILKSRSLIREFNENEIGITEEGVKMAVSLTKEPFTNFGLVSPTELMEMSSIFIYRIYNETRIKNEKIPFSKIQEMFTGYGINVIKQMLRLYDKCQWILYKESDQIIAATDEGINYFHNYSSMNKTSVEINIFIHDVMNPPYQNSGSNVRLALVNSSNKLKLLINGPDVNECHYVIFIPNAALVGFTSSDPYIVRREIRDFILALNLSMLRGCANGKGTKYKSMSYSSDSPEQIINSGIVEKNAGDIKIHLFENVSVGDYVSTSVTTSDKIDEIELIGIFTFIKNFNRFQKKKTISDRNFALALRHYEAGISKFDRLSKFFEFYHSLELMINIKGLNLQGSEIDRTISITTGMDQTFATTIRQLRNNTIHERSDSTTDKILHKEIAKVPLMTFSIREALQKLIKTHLKTLT